MKIPICVSLFIFFTIAFSDVKAQVTANYYCRSNGALFILPLGITNDCNMARCMFETYFRAVGRKIDNNIVYCNPVFMNEDYTIIDYPTCGNGANSGLKVTIYVDQNYGGGSMSFGPGTIVRCMDTTPRNTSFWGEKGINVAGRGDPVRNDEITSIKVPAGLVIICYIDCGFGGAARSFTSDCPNVGPAWNDKISSFRVQYAAPSARTIKKH